MHSRKPADDNMVLDYDMPGDGSVIRKNDMVSDCAVVCDV